MYRNQHFGNKKCMSINILEYYSTNQDKLNPVFGVKDYIPMIF